MYTINNFYNLPTPIYSGDSQTKRLQAALDCYRRSQMEGRLGNVFARLTGHCTCLKNLERLAAEGQVVSRRHVGLRSVSLSQICGSEGRSEDFDLHFHPLRCHTQQRWLNVMLARQQDVPLPPVELIQIGDAYFVRDGHHRISVAHARGEKCIEAEVTVWVLAGASGPVSTPRMAAVRAHGVI
jgi:hypothetical protein